MKIFMKKIIESAEKIEEGHRYNSGLATRCICGSLFRRDNKRGEIMEDIENVLKSVNTENFDRLYSKLYFKYKDICEFS